jgi:ribosomal protein S18 acetylase RimI-like enzyme
MSTIIVRKATVSDREAVCDIAREIVEDGTTHPFNTNSSDVSLLEYFFPSPGVTFVACIDGDVVGACFIKPNQPGRGAHVANASFVVQRRRTRQGIGRAMTERCLVEAQRQGYRSMCFNFVVSTNTAAITLWKQMGFEIVGKLPEAFNHATAGFVDCYVMSRRL